MIKVETGFEPDFDKEGASVRVGHYEPVAVPRPFNGLMWSCGDSFSFPKPEVSKCYWDYLKARQAPKEIVVEPIEN